MKLFSHLLDNNTNAIEKVNPMDVKPIISRKDSLYFFDLYVLCINSTMVNASNNFTKSRCVKKKITNNM